MKLCKVHFFIEEKLEFWFFKVFYNGKSCMKKIIHLLTAFLHIWYTFQVYKLSELSLLMKSITAEKNNNSKLILNIFYFYNSLPSHREIRIFDWPIWFQSNSPKIQLHWQYPNPSHCQQSMQTETGIKMCNFSLCSQLKCVPSVLQTVVLMGIKYFRT